MAKEAREVTWIHDAPDDPDERIPFALVPQPDERIRFALVPMVEFCPIYAAPVATSEK
jgi:hypothetical protein